MTLNEAERVASAGRRIEDRLDRAARQGVAPKAEPFFRGKIDVGDEVVTLELGIAAEPVGVYLEWAGKRVVVGLDRRNVLLIALTRIGEDAADIRRASGLRAPATMSLYNDGHSFDHRPHVANIFNASRRGEMGQRGNATILERATGEATARRVKSCVILAARGRRNGPLRANSGHSRRRREHVKATDAVIHWMARLANLAIS